MSTPDLTTCAFCPRLCRHVCPVAVGTAREAATPTAMMTAALLTSAGRRPAEYAREAASLCLDCGACTSHCKHHVPVADLLRPFAASAPEAMPLAVIEGVASAVCVVTGEVDWSSGWSRASGRPAARLRTADELGHAAWRAGDDGVPARVAAHLRGRTVITASSAVEAVARAAGLAVERLPAEPQGLLFVTCFDGPHPSPHQLACCGRRDGFAQRSPGLAAEIAAENVRRFEGRPVSCADGECAAWLRAAGALVHSPLDPFQE